MYCRKMLMRWCGNRFSTTNIKEESSDECRVFQSGTSALEHRCIKLSQRNDLHVSACLRCDESSSCRSKDFVISR
ncbi:hypothetical protein PsorP6_000764 [Peronosclerospora sorghi]|uniref:Uncharacterized protein n=1 Tax=Peronosclerospora sorghi TaxID=230839 RepID=A0ACC0WWN8_9STRA|nr:hypothetical protein PsorP6_000764 [Peronosclerospora sorghi]